MPWHKNSWQSDIYHPFQETLKPQIGNVEMLTEIYSGYEMDGATLHGSFHFASPPAAGESVELDGKLFIVSSSWHKPDVHYAGAKFAALITPISQGQTWPAQRTVPATCENP
ncbi:hypothetical protein WBP07_22595 (plasmid) [Novosphingobium sp. BL-8A]